MHVVHSGHACKSIDYELNNFNQPRWYRIISITKLVANTSKCFTRTQKYC